MGTIQILYLQSNEGNQMNTLNTTQLCLTDRQVTILGIALTNLYDEIAKSGEGHKMRDDIMILSAYIQKQYEEYHQ